MKNDWDKSFEDQLRIKLSAMDPSLPMDGFANIRQELQVRKKRRWIIFWIFLFFLSFSGGLMGWLYTPKQAAIAEQKPLVLSPPEKNAVSPKQNAEALPNKKEGAIPASVAQKKGPNQPAKSATIPSSEKEDKIQLVELVDAVDNPLVEPEFKVSENQQPKPNNKAATNDPILPFAKLAHRPIPVLPNSKAILSPGVVFHPESPLHLQYEWTILPGINYYHIIPNQKDDAHFYALDDQRTDLTLGTSFGLWKPVSGRLTAGLQAHYFFTRTALRLQHIEKESGQNAIIQLPNSQEPLYFADYRRKFIDISGDFHQLGIGTAIRYHLFSISDKVVETQIEGSYFKLLNKQSESLFPNQELRLALSFGIKQPLKNNLELAIRPGFAYGFSLHSATEMLQINRMTIGLGISISAN